MAVVAAVGVLASASAVAAPAVRPRTGGGHAATICGPGPGLRVGPLGRSLVGVGVATHFRRSAGEELRDDLVAGEVVQRAAEQAEEDVGAQVGHGRGVSGATDREGEAVDAVDRGLGLVGGQPDGGDGHRASSHSMPMTSRPATARR